MNKMKDGVEEMNELESAETLDTSSAAKVKAFVLSIDDPKMLSYMSDLIYARQQIGRADARLDEKPDKENKSDQCCGPYPTPEPKKFKSLGIPTEPENMDEIS